MLRTNTTDFMASADMSLNCLCWQPNPQKTRQILLKGTTMQYKNRLVVTVCLWIQRAATKRAQNADCGVGLFCFCRRADRCRNTVTWLSQNCDLAIRHRRDFALPLSTDTP
jgi:hypothetical protein